VLDRLRRFKPYKDAANVGVFLSMPGGEVQTDAIVRDAFEAGKSVFVPYLHKNSSTAADAPKRVMDMVRLHSLKDYESLQKDKWDIPSVDAGTVHERRRMLGNVATNGAELYLLDLVLMPGVAFELDTARNIRRLGHGKGFYDFFIQRYRAKLEALEGAKRSLILCALALEEQMVSAHGGDHVPVGPLDQPLDALILGNGELIEAAKTNQ
jgi:5-formyltetrahydrofolate cyclo-ligase